MTALVFVDANVLLYARDASEPAKQPRARAWLEYLWREALGRTSVQVLSEYYVNLKRKGSAVSPEDAWQDTRMYFAWHPRELDEEVFLRARDIEQRFRLSWWDSLIVAAAQLQDCGVLLTEDLQDGALLGAVAVRSPFTYSIGEPTVSYVAPPLRVRHRPRGRPPRTAIPA